MNHDERTCIITGKTKALCLINDEGRRVMWSNDYKFLVFVAEERGMVVVPNNSRAGRTILDKLEGHVV